MQRSPSRCLATLLGILLANWLLFAAVSVTAADEKTDTDVAAPTDPYGRDNPRNMQTGLIAALQQRNYPLAANYLDVKKPDSDAAAQQARAFKHFLDDHGTFDRRLGLSQEPGGRVDDGLPPDQERIGEIQVDDETVPVIAVRVTPKDGQPIWLVSPETLARVPVAEDKPSAEVVQAEAEEAAGLTLFGAPIQSWLILFAVGVGIYAAVVLVVRLLRAVAGFLDEGRVDAPVVRMVTAFAHPAALYVVYVVLSRMAAPLGAGVTERTALERMSGFIGWIALAWFLWRLVGVLNDFAVHRAREAGRFSHIGMANFIARLVRMMLIAASLAVGLATFGIDVTAGLAALGIGGLALALGARKAVEDLVGSVMVLMDKPVRIGDRCLIDGIEGHVEDIGLRSTRIRTLDRTILTIPNSKFADAKIENLTRRDRFRINQWVDLSQSIGVERLGVVLQTIRKAYMDDHASFPVPNPVRVRELAEGNYRVQLVGYLKCHDNHEFYEAQERLMLDIMRRLEGMGVALAVPASRLELSKAAAQTMMAGAATP